MPNRSQMLAMAPEASLRASITDLRQLQRGPSPKEWANLYATLALVFPQGATSPEQASLRFQIFCADLAGIPGPAIAAACERYRREPSPDGKQKFFPQSWQIIAMCEDAKRQAGQILRACDEMERILAEGDVSDAKSEFPNRAAQMRQLADRLAVKPREAAVEAVAPTIRLVAASRPNTDAAELKAALARRTGTAA